jgi:DNA-binding transcriptional MerR regulator
VTVDNATSLSHYLVVSADDVRYAIGDLATLGGVSRRTVRYYVQEGLIPAPLGVGRGNHYATAHLDQLLRVKALQEAGQTLDEIRRALESPSRAARIKRSSPSAPATAPALGRSLWRRLSVAPGVELHVDSTVDLPSPSALRELAEWCQRHLDAASARADDKDQE